MIRQLKITVLVENTAGKRGLMAEHGLAFWVEADDRRILFDTGQGMVLAHNAHELGIDLHQAADVVLSHGHFDHTGGLKHVFGNSGHANLYVHPEAFAPKYVRRPNGESEENGSPYSDVEALRPHAKRIILTKEPTQIADGIWVTGEIPRNSPFEDTGGPFFKDAACTQDDPILDDQAMYLDTVRGLVVLLGCGHAGLVNTLNYVAHLTRRDRIYAVLGGMHLLRADERRLRESEAVLRHFSVERIGPAHCTGRKATMRLWSQFPRQCVECKAGACLQLG